MTRKLLIFDADATLRRCTVPEQGCPNETTFVGDLDTDRLAAEAAGVNFQWAWDFCGKSKHEWTTWLLQRVQANIGPAWVPVGDHLGDMLVMRFDRGGCPICVRKSVGGRLRPRVSIDYRTYRANQCDVCSAVWYLRAPEDAPIQFSPQNMLQYYAKKNRMDDLANGM